MPSVITGSIQASPARRRVDAHFRSREWQQALDALESILRAGDGRPSDLLLRARILTNMKRYEDAIAQAHNAAAALHESAGIANVLKTCHFHLGDVENAIGYGQAAIERRDQESGEALAPLALMQNSSGKDVIAFSLWGARDAYCLGAVINASICPYIFPGWQARFYVGADVPVKILETLRHAGAEIVKGDPEIPSYFWRFLVMNDPGVRRFLCRDTDARLSSREARMVQEWIESGQSFHVIRDHVLHSELILAGMWGGHATGTISVTELMRARATDAYGSDQFFLAREIWPRVKRDVCVHDLHYATPGVPSKHSVANIGADHVGAGRQNDASVRLEWVRLRGESPRKAAFNAV
jgi:hypothetical protein